MVRLTLKLMPSELSDAEVEVLMNLFDRVGPNGNVSVASLTFAVGEGASHFIRHAHRKQVSIPLSSVSAALF